MNQLIFGCYLIAGLVLTCMPIILESVSSEYYDNGGDLISEFLSNIGIFFYVLAGILAGTSFIKKK